MVHSICESFWMTAKRLVYLSLGYLRLDLASSTLFTGERQRMRLARAVRNRNMVFSRCWMSSPHRPASTGCANASADVSGNYRQLTAVPLSL